jgi:Arc/MetJ-type ribon-helix-helix transcriptional regulator
LHVTIPESLKPFVEQQITSGRYADADAFVADLLRAEALIFERIGRGEAVPVDEHFDRRLEVLLEQAKDVGDYVDVTPEDFDAMEREAQEMVRKRRDT